MDQTPITPMTRQEMKEAFDACMRCEMDYYEGEGAFDAMHNREQILPKSDKK
jgi:hypothetical protein